MGPYWSSRLLPALHPQSLTLFLLVSLMGFTCAQAQLSPFPCTVPTPDDPVTSCGCTRAHLLLPIPWDKVGVQ